ncbi:putative TPR repeat-containing protein, partial [Ananas comosus]
MRWGRTSGPSRIPEAIDLKPGTSMLFTTSWLYMDMGGLLGSRDYTGIRLPATWRTAEQGGAQEAFKMSQRTLQKKKKQKPSKEIEPSKFKRVGQKTTLRQDLANALDIRAFQRLTRLGRCDVELLRKEMSETDVPISYSGTGVPEKSIRKAPLEVILRRLLRSLKPDSFQGAIKVINERVLSVLDASGSGRVDLGMFFAVIAPICHGSTDRRKRVVYDALLWRPTNESGAAQIRRADALAYIKILRAVYIPSHGVSDMMEMHGESDPSLVSYAEFLEMFNDPDWGFGILGTL